MIGLSALGYADEHFPFLAQVSKESVNIRSGANTNFEKLDKLSKGAEVIVLGKAFDWYKVQLPSTTKAFVRADYVKINQNSNGQILGDKVHIRAAPNSESTSLGIIKQGEPVKTVAQVNGWWQIEPPTQAVGWIRQDFLSLKSTKIETKTPVEHKENKAPAVTTVDVKGKLTALALPKGDLRYELLVDGKVVYYIRSTPNLDHFKGATVLIKGIVTSDQSNDHPVLRVVNISLLL